MRTGVCYYPEHWPESRWTTDAAHMRRLGLSVIRIGEFAWSRLEDREGNLDFNWLKRAMDTLHEAGLSVVLGTPTATPPRWMLDKYPDMLAVDEYGRLRDFGSRRHYCFSFEPYIAECERIVTLLAQCFTDHPALIGWQTDNEYGCHSTSISYSTHALAAFRVWCEKRYLSIDALNQAWGNVFWSMEYDNFEQIGLPTGTVTESNPSHQLAYWRFSSDQIVKFNRAQVDVLRKISPGKDILHNFMGNFVEFDHHAVSQDLDIASWDNYPLGFLTRDSSDPTDVERFYRTGHPDSSSFHHDLYRGCCKGRWWVMEQQPGPVNWAPFNPSPVDGMVRLWGWEAFAHGAEVMSYFRWRQAPFAQEQTHTGLLLSNAEEDTAAGEVAQLNQELEALAAPGTGESVQTDTATQPVDAARMGTSSAKVESDVAIVFSYAGIAIQAIQPPGGETYTALGFCQRVYGACRQWGVNVDIVSPQTSLEHYKLIILCTSTEDDAGLVEGLASAQRSSNPTIVMFPGTGSRTAEYQTPDTLAPGSFQQLLQARVTRTESLPATVILSVTNAQGVSRACKQWREKIASDIQPSLQFEDGWGFHYQQGNVHYINALPEQADLIAIVGELLGNADIPARELGPFVRTQKMGPYRVAYNFGTQPVELDKCLGDTLDFHHDTHPVVGSRVLNQAEVAVWVVR